MTADSDKRTLEARELSLPYTHEDAGTLSIQRLATALRDRYQFDRLIGRGGAAYVYLARDLRDNRLVALKLLRPEFSADITEARFHREIEIVRGLQHDNILSLLDFGSIDGLVYFTMPYVEGDTLRARMRQEKQFELGSAIAITRDIASALDYAHQRGVLHRDIKPPNILLDNGRVLVADFGVARAMTVAAGEEITTHSGLAIGTPEYMSPEQGSGDRHLDERCDIYALGCVLYEMLAGEPPFTGPNAQAVIARHCSQAPQSIRVIRPSIPRGVERAIEKALAKVPADRFPTGAKFVAALEAGSHDEPLHFFDGITRPTRRLIFASLVVTAAAAVTWYATRSAAPALDLNRVVVFPLRDQSVGATENAGGEAVATYVGYALNGTRPLKWLDGWELLDDAHRSTTGRIDLTVAHRLTRIAGAGFFIDGSIVRRPDSVTVILRLFSAGADSAIRVAGRSAPTARASPPQLGVAAVGDLLPALVAPGGRIDVSAFTNRKPVAIANFLEGEREYRRMQFGPALQHYQLALATDSAFALAAGRGAYAANWLSEFDAADELAETAIRNSSSLPPAQVLLTRGLHNYLTGSADSAVRYLRLAIGRDSTIHAGWTLLGEVYSRLLPDVANADSLAADALTRARRTDPDFAPTLLLLEERALRDGRIKDALIARDELRKAGADTTHLASRALMLRCVRDGPATVDWRAALHDDEMVVLSSGKILAGGAAQPDCSISIFRTIVAAESTTVNARWAAFVGLQSELAAVNRGSEARREFSRREVAGLPLKFVYLLLASNGPGFEREAIAAADSAVGSYERSSVPLLWHLGTWEAHRHNAPRLRLIAQALRRKADSSGSRRDKLVRDAITARLTLLEGDSVTALRLLRDLRPSAPREQLAWDAWESLGPERLQLAELLFARGSLRESFGVASELDATEPLTYPIYLRRSLTLRLRIAETLGDANSAAEYRRKLSQLNSSG